MSDKFVERRGVDKEVLRKEIEDLTRRLATALEASENHLSARLDDTVRGAQLSIYTTREMIAKSEAEITKRLEAIVANQEEDHKNVTSLMRLIVMLSGTNRHLRAEIDGFETRIAALERLVSADADI